MGVAVAAGFEGLGVEAFEVGHRHVTRVEVARPLGVGFFGHRWNRFGIDFEVGE